MYFRRLIIGLLCLAGLAVVLDFGVAAYSEYRVSRLLRQGSGLGSDPEVTFRESILHPFVSQALDGEFENVKIRTRTPRTDVQGSIYSEADLRGVRLPMRDLVDGVANRVPVDEVNATMRFESVDLGRLFKIPDLQVLGPSTDKSDGSGGSGGSGITSTQLKPGLIRLAGTISLYPDSDDSAVSLSTVPTTSKSKQVVSVLAELRLDGDQVHIIATDIYRGSDSSPAAVVPEAEKPAVVPESEKAAVLARFTRTIDVRDLPFGIMPTKVQALGGVIIVEGTAENVVLDLDRLQQP
ncbi:LmeA family phospholipid-binding protein [Nocardia huaxiensis]|uniref:DUF2993 domain-containing protein n=1 Tax=Nocardia huaxiensis TaxID=2755382 RepID=A0A7D6VKG1_9NOCA|nr:LmeA family phospholipid-binding protein [Nocardia huaxiensis]QLY31610.1 DUF2993 domain-containing protein [Nocardia huaxiensis]UFS95163.1 LmeA family phospholipid-binding protein [Nocardia huaxiensis]